MCIHSARKPLASFQGAGWSWMMQILSCQAAVSATWIKGRVCKDVTASPPPDLASLSWVSSSSQIISLLPAPCPGCQCCCKLWVKQRNLCFPDLLFSRGRRELLVCAPLLPLGLQILSQMLLYWALTTTLGSASPTALWGKLLQKKQPSCGK